jgi:hypothetical protein
VEGVIPAVCRSRHRNDITRSGKRNVGGHEALAALRIAELHAAGMLGSDDMVTVRDPFDPDRVMIELREDCDG